jgi:putative endonuclease
MQTTKLVGSAGEQLAADYLSAHGYTIIAYNYSVHHVGEIDLIARKDEFLICTEVKTRSSLLVPFEFLIPKSKQQKIIKTARFYVQQHRFFDAVVRFDVVFVDLSAGCPIITHLPQAFEADR